MRYFSFFILLFFFIESLSAQDFSQRLKEIDSLLSNSDDSLAKLKLNRFYQFIKGRGNEIELDYMKAFHGDYYLSVKDYPESKKWYMDLYEKKFSFNPPIDSSYLTKMARAINDMGIVLYRMGEFNLAKKAHKKSLGMYQQLADDSGLAMNFNNLGITAKAINQKDSAVYFYENGLQIAENSSDSVGIAHISNSLGQLYLAQLDYSSALDSYLNSLSYFEAMNNEPMISSVLVSLGQFYSTTKEENKAGKMLNRAIGYEGKMSDRKLSEAYYIRAGLYKERFRKDSLTLYLDSAIYFYDEALLQAKKASSNYHYFLSFGSKIEAEFASGLGFDLTIQKYDSAIEGTSRFARLNRELIIDKAWAYYEQEMIGKALETAKILNFEEINDKYTLRRLYFILAESYQRTGDYKNASTFFRNLRGIYDEIIEEGELKKIAQAEYKYDLAVREKEQQRLLAKKEQEELALQTEIQQQRKFTVLVIVIFAVAVILLLLTFREYTAKNKANTKLKQLDQFKTRLFANINHDFRTPITLIQGYVHLIRERTDDYLSKGTLQDLKKIEDSASVLTEMTNEIHNLLLLEEGKLTLDLEPVDLVSHLSREVKMFESMAELSKIDLQFVNMTSTSTYVLMDQNYFNKIVFNLMSNAFRFTTEGGTIHVILASDANHASLLFKDSGKGILPQDLPYVFDRFYQSSLNEYRSKEGFGIGLAVVKELIDLHKGSISVTSEEGVGTTFNIRLALTQEQPVAEEMKTVSVNQEILPTKTAKETMVTSGENGRHSVMVVDDHEEIRSYIANLIKEEYVIKEAANGAQALRILEKDHIDLIITDLMMPHLDGYELIERLGENERLKNIPVMVVSARTSTEDRHKVLDAGVNEFISKPFDPKEFQKRVQNMIHEKNALNGWSQLIENGATNASLDKGILEKLNQLITDHISDPNLNIDRIAAELSASRSKAIRMIKELTGHTPLHYIKIIRMDFVKEAIRLGKVKNATEAARLIGMKNATQFANQYQKHFGIAPFDK